MDIKDTSFRSPPKFSLASLSASTAKNILDLSEMLLAASTFDDLEKITPFLNTHLNISEVITFSLKPKSQEFSIIYDSKESTRIQSKDITWISASDSTINILNKGNFSRGGSNEKELLEAISRVRGDKSLIDESVIVIPSKRNYDASNHTCLFVFSRKDETTLDFQYLSALSELFLVSTINVFENEEKKQLRDFTKNLLNRSGSIYASWDQKKGWSYHNFDRLVDFGHSKEKINFYAENNINPIHRDDREAIIKDFKHGLIHGNDYEHDYRLVGPNGNETWFQAKTSVARKNSDGSTREIVSISRNIESIKHAEIAAKNAEKSGKWLLEQTEHIFDCNNFSNLNISLKEIALKLGLHRATIRVVDPNTLNCNLVAEYHDEGLESLAVLFPNIISSTGTGWIGDIIEHGDAFIVNNIPTESSKNIARHYKEMSTEAVIVQPMIENKNLIGFMVLLREKPHIWTEEEISNSKIFSDAIHLTIQRNRVLDDLRASEERFQLAMKNSMLGYWEHFPQKKSLIRSPHLLEALGYQEDEFEYDQPLDGLVHPEDQHLVYGLLYDWYTGDEDICEQELRLIKSNGDSIWVLIRGKIIERDKNGNVLRSAGINVGIDDLKAAQTNLKQARKKAELANSSKSEFLERMSHEIRMPMNAIIGMSYLALGTELDSEQESYLQDIEGAANSLLHVIDDILDFSKIESGELLIVSEAFNLRNELRRITKLFTVRAQQSGNEIILSIGDDIPQVLIGDPYRLSQVITNLLSNAVKFTANGTITLSVQNADSNDTLNTLSLLFSVHDSGIGLSEKQVKNLFEPYIQAEASTTREFGGTGLGLSICKHLVEMMGGSINVISLPKVGTTFHFTVVFKQQDLNAIKLIDAESTNIFSPSDLNTSLFKGKKVLITEDNIVNQKVAAGILAKLGIAVVTANNGSEALDILKTTQRNEFDAILMDIEMPVKDGIETTKEIRQHPEFDDLPIIAMTAHAMVGDKEKCLRAGMNDHIAKPVNPGNLAQILAQAWQSQ